MIRKNEIEQFEIVEHITELCVVGGGIAGMCASIAAARKGTKVVLMHDRPVLGGNASSEIRMWIRGAEGEFLRETGLIEEIALENIYRNPNMNYSIWDSILWEKVALEKNITLLLNCSCMDAKMEGDKICFVKGWQTTTQQYHQVYAEIFADCSGDSVLAPLTGASYRIGREGYTEFGETIAPENEDRKTMGLSCLLQARQTNKKVDFTAPLWANKYKKEDFYYRMDFSTPSKWTEDNFWWIEIGGEQDSIHDTESIRDELIKIAYGVWDFIKNSGEVEAECWDLEWLGFLPGKRESRRYEGDYILKQDDLREKRNFEDIIAYGGWTMDNHDPEGFKAKNPPTKWNEVRSPYGIPYRCIYSRNIQNLMFAGRNISATHSANSSVRVMATCGVLGHALGNAAHIAVRHNVLPKQIADGYIEELKQSLMEDDNYLPQNKKIMSAIMKKVKIISDGSNPEILIDGSERPEGGCSHLWIGELNKEIVLELDEKKYIKRLRMVFDSDLERNTWREQKWYVKRYPMICNRFLDDKPVRIPETLLKAFDIYIAGDDGIWELLHREKNNYQRLVYVSINKIIYKLKLVPKDTWGCKESRIFSLELQT